MNFGDKGKDNFGEVKKKLQVRKSRKTMSEIPFGNGSCSIVIMRRLVTLTIRRLHLLPLITQTTCAIPEGNLNCWFFLLKGLRNKASTGMFFPAPACGQSRLQKACLPDAGFRPQRVCHPNAGLCGGLGAMPVEAVH